MAFVNDLATNYTLSDNGLTWTFTLRDNAKFTDGQPVTAQDVAFTFNTAKESQSSLDLTFMDKAEAVDSTTVVFTLSKPPLPSSIPLPPWALCRSTPMARTQG